MRVPVLLGLGANLGDPAGQLAAAVAMLRPTLDIEAVSSVYRTEPVGLREQPEFLNLVLRGITTATVYELHAQLQTIERRLGRTRDVPNAPRLIDVDLLAYGELALTSADLVVPHPRLAERSFVLEPLVEIAPEWRHPLSGRTARQLLGALQAPSRVTREGPLAAGTSG